MIFLIGNSLRQILRKPAAVVMSMVLFAVAVFLLSLGVNLWLTSSRNLEALEAGFTTIGTVEQIPNASTQMASWDLRSESYVYFNRPVYDSAISVSDLNFPGANYIHAPEKRPFYGAWHEDFVTSEYPNSQYDIIIVEAEPLEDYIPPTEDYISPIPVLMRVKRILYGNPGALTEFLFYDVNRACFDPMQRGRTYVMKLLVQANTLTPGYEDYPRMIYAPTPVYSSQRDRNGVVIPDEIGPIYYDEVTEGYYDTPRGQRWNEQIEGLEKEEKTIPVVPTGATNLLMAFYSGEAQIVGGRDITPEEYEEGHRVCLVSRGFARNNNLNVGDTIPLQMYYANYSTPLGIFADSTILPTTGGLLSAEGKSYPIFEQGIYEIVGIYSEISQSSAFSVGQNAVIIPQASVENSDENNILNWRGMQAHNTSFEIPNGTIDEFLENWSAQNIDGLELQFYDRGYSELKDGFDRMRTLSAILIIATVAVIFLVLIFYIFHFIIKNKRRTAIERSLGIGRKKIAAALVTATVAIPAVGIALGAGIGYLLSDFITQLADMFADTQMFDTYFSSWVNNANKVAEIQDTSTAADFSLFLAVALIVFLLSLIFALLGALQNLKSEPLALLSGRENV